MPSPAKGARLGGGAAHERLMLGNLATALFEHGKITTTHAKAKRLRPVAERLITFAKRGDLAARRRVMTVVKDKTVVHELFTEIGPSYAGRPGGYTRIIKIGNRKGDNAPMAIIELVEPMLEQVVAEATGATKRAAKEADAKTQEAKAQETEAQETEPAEPAKEESEADLEAEADAPVNELGEDEAAASEPVAEEAPAGDADAPAESKE